MKLQPRGGGGGGDDNDRGGCGGGGDDPDHDAAWPMTPADIKAMAAAGYARHQDEAAIATSGCAKDRVCGEGRRRVDCRISDPLIGQKEFNTFPSTLLRSSLIRGGGGGQGLSRWRVEGKAHTRATQCPKRQKVNTEYCLKPGSNQRPSDLQSDALPTELLRRILRCDAQIPESLTIAE